MLAISAIWRHFPALCPSRYKSERDDDTSEEDSTVSEDEGPASGTEWLFIEEPVGFFVPKMQKRMQQLQLDQTQHLLHYGNFKHIMRLHNISLVTLVEETDACNIQKWWMTVQDPSTLQVWVIHFPSRHRLQAWLDLLSSVFKATYCHAVVSELIVVSTQETAPPS